MVGKRSHKIDGLENVGNTADLSHNEEDKLLKDDDAEIKQPPRTKPAASEQPNDMLGATLLKLNDNMLSVTQSMSAMQQTLARFADGQKPSKRPRVNELSDTDTDSNEDVSEISEDDSDALLEGAKSCPTQDTKDDLLDTIANDLNADEQTDQDMSDKLAKLINKRWS